MQLLFAVIWLALGVGIFVYHFSTGKAWVIQGLNISPAWICLVFAAWNGVRWYVARAYRAEQETIRAAEEARLRQARHRDRPSEPDPNFDFSEKPPQP